MTFTVGCGGACDRALGRVQELHVRETGELEVAAAAVDLARLLEALADVLLRVALAGLQLEERLQELGVDDLVAVELDLADAIAVAFGDRDAQLHPARFLVRRNPRAS